MSNIITLINADRLLHELQTSLYDPDETHYLVQGFRNGFDIGYDGPKLRQSRAKNLPISVGSHTELWNKIIKEVKTGRVAGPFDEIPYQNFIQSPIGLVPKAGGKSRLIFHLSYDFGDKSQQKSLNYHTPEELTSVKYNDLDTAVKNCLLVKSEQKQLLGNQTKVAFEEEPIHLGKTDVQSAFRLVPLSILCWSWLIMMAVNPITKKMQYFIDKCLSFGASISCSIFQRFSDALKHIFQFCTGTRHHVMNYLDDFLFVAYCKMMCNELIKQFLSLCSELGVPIAPEKTEWACTQLVFMGILLDGWFMLLAIPEEKHLKAIYLISKLIDKRKATIKELQVLCGYLNFLNKAIYPGCAFTRHMYTKYAIHWSKSKKTSKVKLRQGMVSQKLKSGSKLKPFHHVRLDKEFKLDCTTWLQFLMDENLAQVILRLMIDINSTATSQQLRFWTDASTGANLGFGCIFEKRWTYKQWPSNFIKIRKPSIEFLELFALCAGLFTWQDQLTNYRIIIFL